MSYKTLTLAIFVFVLTITTTCGLECYSCSASMDETHTNYDCLYFSPKYDENKRTLCRFPEDVCSKFIANHNGQKWVHRGCASPTVCSDLHQTYNRPTDQLIECHECRDKDLCNSAVVGDFSMVLITVIFVLYCIV
ncbi:uncharacterized protein LOC126266527 [Aethina tumida]|uniref:uncharacterized protein LOC126266527 n=1 Tax=Aethina tumida TaxID=116153 RepID=UPI00214831B2|nr:uncharacterized protein LOC126266527 [Aethina tumida]